MSTSGISNRATQHTGRSAHAGPRRLNIALANDEDRLTIYRLRHEVYAGELAQHKENPHGLLRDPLDDFNLYVTASVDGEIVGFISVTPPAGARYSMDKYIPRDRLPFAFDDGLYEIRLLTVTKPHRGRLIASLLMYAAFRWVEAHGGTRIMAIGRREILDLYLKAGLQPLGIEIQAGAVTFECLTATTAALREEMGRHAGVLRRLERSAQWRLDVPFHEPAPCFHGGAFFDAIGNEFDALDQSRRIINADVLDAWFPPSPNVLTALQEYLPWLLQTSPPTGCEGMVNTIARARGVDAACILPAAGSSDLIYLALRQWLAPSSRVLLLDPTYGEYAHVLEQVVRCRVDRLPLSRAEGYQCDLSHLERHLRLAYDLVVLVNPNSPTGRHIRRDDLERVLTGAPERTRIWIDETYLEYVGGEQSLERFAAQRANVIICKSMSKVYALSGARAAYACASPHMIDELRALTPPWAVSLPAQVAAVMALQDPGYYSRRYAETHALRAGLVDGLTRASTEMEIVPSVANFVLCHLPADGPDAESLCRQCQTHGLFLRNAGNMSRHLGSHAVRIAVKDADTTRRMVDIIHQALGQTG